MFLIVAEVEPTRRARKPVVVSQLLIINGGTPPHNLINVRPMHTVVECRSAVLAEKG